MSMLRFSQEEQYRYFYIDRKFASGNLQQINEALDELALFLGKMTRTDLINSFIMRMLQLIPSSKALTLKHRIGGIFRHNSQLLVASHSKDQLANSLNKLIKHHEQSTRIVALQIVAHLSSLFHKDVALYHALLGKISGENCLGKSQKKEAIICMSQLLGSSSHLAKLFSKNIVDLEIVYSLPLHILLYLLSFPSIDSHRQLKVLRQLLCLFKNSKEKSSKAQIRLQLRYFEKVLLIYAATNYRIISLYYQSDLAFQLFRIEPQIQRIKLLKYPFLELSHSYKKVTHSELKSPEPFVDMLYAKKLEGKLNREYAQLKSQIYEFIDRTIIKGQEGISKVILLLYFVEENIDQYDLKLKKALEQQNIPCNKILFKQLAVVGCYESAVTIMNHLKIPQLNYLFLTSYFQFKTHKDHDLSELKEIATIIHPDLLNIVKGWELADIILKLGQHSSWSAIHELQKELKEIACQIKGKTKLSNIISIFNIFSNYCQSDSLQGLKQKCSSILPSHIFATNSYWFAHLQKQTLNYVVGLSL